jgi:hypothetical protein
MTIPCDTARMGFTAVARITAEMKGTRRARATRDECRVRHTTTAHHSGNVGTKGPRKCGSIFSWSE